MLQSQLLSNTVQLATDTQLLFLNSAADPFVSEAVQRIAKGTLVLAEDNLAALEAAQKVARSSTATQLSLRSVPFHEYIRQEPPSTIDVAIMNLLYQPANAWMFHGLAVAAYALRTNGRLYVVGAKDRGILTVARRMQDYFGNAETLEIHKGHRVISAIREATLTTEGEAAVATARNNLSALLPFAQGKLDEGTELLLHALEVRVTDTALDIGCGAGYLGLHIARQASQGYVTLVDVSLTAVSLAQHNIVESGLTNLTVLPSNAAHAVLDQRFDLVVTNPPFHRGGEQTTSIAEQFIREASQVLRKGGRFYLVANRFLKYEPVLQAHFSRCEEVAGNTKYKVLRAIR